MTPAEFRAALERAGLSQRAAAPVLGVDERTIRRWVSGERAIPRIAEIALEYVVRYGLLPERR